MKMMKYNEADEDFEKEEWKKVVKGKTIVRFMRILMKRRRGRRCKKIHRLGE